MSNSYAMGQMYPQAYSGAYPQYGYPQNAYPENTQKSSFPLIPAAVTTGALGGATVGYFKNRYPVGKDGSVSEQFAQDVFNKNLKNNASQEVKTYFKQLKEVLKKIDKVKTPEDFRKLINANKLIIEDQCRVISAETLTDAVNSSNIKESKKALKESLQSIMNFEILKTKNAIKLGWDSESKKFVKKPEFKDEKLFKVIKNTKSGEQFKRMFKYGGFAALAAGIAAAGYKVFTNRAQTS